MKRGGGGKCYTFGGLECIYSTLNNRRVENHGVQLETRGEGGGGENTGVRDTAE